MENLGGKQVRQRRGEKFFAILKIWQAAICDGFDVTKVFFSIVIGIGGVEDDIEQNQTVNSYEEEKQPGANALGGLEGGDERGDKRGNARQKKRGRWHVFKNNGDQEASVICV